MTCSRAGGFGRSGRRGRAEATWRAFPDAESRARIARGKVLSPLRPADPDPAPLEPPSRNPGGPRLPLGGGLGHRVRRADPTRPESCRAQRSAKLDRPPVAGPGLGPPDRDPPRSRARTASGTGARERPTAGRRARRVLEGLSVPRPRRDRATPLRLSPPDPRFAGLLCRLSHGGDLELPRVRPPATPSRPANAAADHGMTPIPSYGT